MTRQDLVQLIRKKRSFLCVGLDTDLSRIPAHLQDHPDPVFEFNKAIIDATHEYCMGFKINTAFYEARGLDGWQSMIKTVSYIPRTHFKIADAKRGDIGNTSAQYAKAFFETLDFDAVTVNPYMGKDCVHPFLDFPGKWAIVLALTSNPGADDFETLRTDSGQVFEKVIRTASRWGSEDQMMFVVGATQAAELGRIRKLAPHHFFLVPGIGAQGGDVRSIAENGLNKDVGVIVNVSRDIIYASSGHNFAELAAERAKAYQKEMIVYI
jgi:orotidine-5'-phosphate decarboxylase